MTVEINVIGRRKVRATWLELSVPTLRGSDGKKPSGLPRERPYLWAFAILLCAVALLAPAAADARDLVLYGEPTLEKALKLVGSLWQARTGTLSMSFVRARAAINGPL